MDFEFIDTFDNLNWVNSHVVQKSLVQKELLSRFEHTNYDQKQIVKRSLLNKQLLSTITKNKIYIKYIKNTRIISQVKNNGPPIKQKMIYNRFYGLYEWGIIDSCFLYFNFF